MSYTIRPLAGTLAIFELLDDGGEVVAMGYEAPLRLAVDVEARTYTGPCACGKAHAAPPIPPCQDLECHGECRSHGTERDV